MITLTRAKTKTKICTKFSIYDIPLLRLTLLAIFTTGLFVLEMYLNAEILMCSYNYRKESLLPSSYARIRMEGKHFLLNLPLLLLKDDTNY